MSNLYRGMQGMNRRPPSRGWSTVGIALAVAASIGLFFLAVRWFRGDAEPLPDETATAEAEAEVTLASSQLPTQSQSTLQAVGGYSADGTASRIVTDQEYVLTIVANLPSIDTATTAYEVWFVKPGITDFFSLGEMYPREDGKWGLVWQQQRALVRNDIGEFTRLMVISEPRDGDSAPSSNHVLDGQF